MFRGASIVWRGIFFSEGAEDFRRLENPDSSVCYQFRCNVPMALFEKAPIDVITVLVACLRDRDAESCGMRVD